MRNDLEKQERLTKYWYEDGRSPVCPSLPPNCRLWCHLPSVRSFFCCRMVSCFLTLLMSHCCESCSFVSWTSSCWLRSHMFCSSVVSSCSAIIDFCSELMVTSSGPSSTPCRHIESRSRSVGVILPRSLSRANITI